MKPADRVSALRDALETLHATGSRGLLLAALVSSVSLPTLLGGETLTQALRYERPSIANGEWWRLLGAQFVHLDAGHALANAAGTVLVWALVGSTYRAAVWVAIVAAALASVAAGLWWGSPEVLWYVGASGWLHGLLAAGALPLAMSRGDRLGRIVLLALAGKLIWEQLMGPLSGGSTAVIVSAHAYGAAGGFSCGALFLRGRRSAAAATAPRDSAPL
jgi:rhomboid family GlyGly-CTERM serine protease